MFGRNRALTLLFFLLCSLPLCAQTDKDKLGMALDYFQSQKYQEALALFETLDKDYKLNPRFLAYIGVCHYYLWHYKEACQYLDSVMTKITIYAPHERSVYYFSDAESHFYLHEFDKAIDPYEKTLTVCHDNERAEVLCKLGFCYIFMEDWAKAQDRLRSSLAYFKRFLPNEKARIAQVGTMLRGVHAKISLSIMGWEVQDMAWKQLFGHEKMTTAMVEKPDALLVNTPQLATTKQSPTEESKALSPKNLSLGSGTDVLIDITAKKPGMPNFKLDIAIAEKKGEKGQQATLPSETTIKKDTITSPATHDIDLSDLYRHEIEVKVDSTQNKESK